MFSNRFRLVSNELNDTIDNKMYLGPPIMKDHGVHGLPNKPITEKGEVQGFNPCLQPSVQKNKIKKNSHSKKEES